MKIFKLSLLHQRSSRRCFLSKRFGLGRVYKNRSHRYYIDRVSTSQIDTGVVHLSRAYPKEGGVICSINSTAPSHLGTIQLVGKNRGLCSRKPGTEDRPYGIFDPKEKAHQDGPQQAAEAELPDVTVVVTTDDCR